jgi:hypothetical protein
MWSFVRATAQDVAMPRAATVWMVRLDRGRAHDDTRGTLELDEDAVVFTDARTGAATRFPFEAVRKPSRVRGSPILMLTLRSDGELRRVAFYFSQPPPLQPPGPGAATLPGAVPDRRTSGPFGAFGRSSKNRHRRSNVGYLSTMNASHKEEIQEWVAEIGAKLTG